MIRAGVFLSRSTSQCSRIITSTLYTKQIHTGGLLGSLNESPSPTFFTSSFASSSSSSSSINNTSQENRQHPLLKSSSHENNNKNNNHNNDNRNNNKNNNNNNNNKNKNNKNKNNFFNSTTFVATAGCSSIAIGAAAVGVASFVTAAEENMDLERPKPKLVILGSGWASVGLLKDIRACEYDIVCVSPRSAFVFTPLLPSACVGSVESRSLVESMRKICAGVNAHFVQAEAQDVDLERKTVICKDSDGKLFEIPYDRLVVAVGARNNTFDTPGVEENCHFLKQVQDARSIRAKIMDNFELASLPTVSVEEKKKLLHFVIVGGGPTGVEVAAEIADLVRDDLIHLFPELCQKYVHVSLVQSGDHILNTYDEKISIYAEEKFKLQNIDVITRARVLNVKPNAVVYSDKNDGGKTKELQFGLCVWSTGIKQVPFVEQLAAHLEQSQMHKRALMTDSRLRVIGAGGDVFAAGDCATMEMPHLLENVKAIFTDADENGDGIISLEEFEHLCTRTVERYPQIEMHIRQIKKLFSLYDADSNQSLDLVEFEKFLNDVNKNLKAFPATAQVASQQGKYLARHLNYLGSKDRIEFMKEKKNSSLRNEMKERVESAPVPLRVVGGSVQPATAVTAAKEIAAATQSAVAQLPPVEQKTVAKSTLTASVVTQADVPTKLSSSQQAQLKLVENTVSKLRNYPEFEPFHYRHFGSLAYIGDDAAAIDFGNGLVNQGATAFVLWRGAYLSNSVSWRTRISIAFDWVKLALFGRDFSRY